MCLPHSLFNAVVTQIIGNCQACLLISHSGDIQMGLFLRDILIDDRFGEPGQVQLFAGKNDFGLFRRGMFDGSFGY